MSRYPHFSEKEFSACTPPCFSQSMNYWFMLRLEDARVKAGVPFVLSCAFRSKSWDVAKGRSGNSYHTLGRAVDIKVTDDRTRFRIVKSLIDAGFKGIGVARTFVHVDDRDTGTYWLYD